MHSSSMPSPDVVRLRHMQEAVTIALKMATGRNGSDLRPLLLNYQSDYNTLSIDDEFMVGTDLLAAPILQSGITSRLVYLPEGTWIDYWTGKHVTGGRTIAVEAPLETVPLFVRGGAIIPMGPEMNYVGEKPADPVSFEIYPDAEGRAAGFLYEDDGVSPAYASGVVRRTTIAYAGGEISVGEPGGSYQPKPRNFVFTVHGPTPAGQMQLDGSPLTLLSGKIAGIGWRRSGDSMTVQYADDGRAHKVQLR